MFCRHCAKSRVVHFYFSTLLLALAAFIAGCGGGNSSSGSSGGPTPSVTAVTVSCNASTLELSAATPQPTSQCAAAVTGTGSHSTLVSWTSSVGTISTSGVFSPAGITAAMNVTVTATSKEDASKSGTATITIGVTALTVNIIDLPAGIAGHVSLTDPNGGLTQVTSSETVLALAGTYAAVAAPVATGAATYETSVPRETVIVESGSTAVVTIDYYDVIPSTTKVLDSAGIQSLEISADGSTLTIGASSSVAQSLQPGDVLIIPPTTVNGNVPTGLLRKVLAVTSDASAITAKVQAATLADAFQRLSIQLSTQVGPSGQAVHTRPGVMFRPGQAREIRQRAGATAATSLQDPCGTASLGVFDIPEPINFDPVQGISFAGQVELCSGFTFNIDLVGKGFLGLQPQLNTLTAKASVGEYSDLSLTGEFLNGSFDPGPITLGTIQGTPIPIAGLPIWVTPEISVFVGAQGNVSTGFSTEVSAAGTTTGGVTYSAGQWTPVQPQPSVQFTYTPPLLGASLNAKAYAGVELDLAVYDLAGPSFKPDGYLDFNADITQNPWWTLTGGLEGPMSLDVGFLGETLASYDLGNMFNYSWLIASAPGPFAPSDSTPSLQSISPQQTAAGGPGFALDVVGSNFVPGATVNFGSTSLVTTWQNSGSLTASVPASLVSTSGTISVTVRNPGGEASTRLSFTITSQPTGTVTIVPESATVEEGGLQIFSATVAGGGGVTWSVEEGSQGGTITSSGAYTAPQATGTFHVIAANAANPSQSATAIVTVVATTPPGIISTVVGGGGYGCQQETDSVGDGCPSNVAWLSDPSGVATDQAGNIYISDTNNNRIRLVNVRAAPITIAGLTVAPGNVVTVAGDGVQGYSGDGGPASNAELNAPFHLAVDGSGNIFISDSNNHVVRLVNVQSTSITYAGVTIQPNSIATIAGGGAGCANQTDSVGDGCPATSAQMSLPDGIGLDQNNNLFIADFYGERIRRIDAVTGVITTVAGNGYQGYSGDGGPAVDAELFDPSRVLVASDGTLYISDYYNYRVRKVDNTGMISTFAGDGASGYAGDGGSPTNAEFGGPLSIALDQSGNVYIADYYNERIRVVNTQSSTVTLLGVSVPPSTIETVVGNGSVGYSGDGGPALEATIDGPTGLWFDKSGNLYFADAINGVVRKVSGP
jgi:NHL repeat